VSRGRSPDYAEDESGVPVINQACIYWDGLRLDKVKWHRSETLRGERGALRPGDLLLNSTGTGTLGRAAIFAGNGRFVADSHVTIVRAADGTEPRFVRYVLQTDIYQGYIYSVLAPGATNQVELSREGFRNTPFPMPPTGEQRAIAHFLDRKMAAIDALIAKKDQFAKLMAEKRQAILTRAVTRGLVTEVQTKPSGVPWFDDVPVSWALSKLKYVSPQVTVGIVVTPARYYVDEGVPALRSFNIHAGTISDDDLAYISPQANDLHVKSRLCEGDLVSVRTGQPGTTAVVNKRFHGANCVDLIIARRSSRFRSRFVCYFMNSGPAHQQYGEGSEGALQQHFNVETAKNLVLPLPPLEEQDAIVAWLDRELGRIDAIVATVERQVSRLREYRQALITAAVTGQLDVAAQPQEAA
jgi:type I restriction enzyme S subunit